MVEMATFCIFTLWTGSRDARCTFRCEECVGDVKESQSRFDVMNESKVCQFLFQGFLVFSEFLMEMEI